MTSEEHYQAFAAALEQPLRCIGGPAEGRTASCAGAISVTFPIQSKTERFYWREDTGLHRSEWHEALYKLDRGEDGLPVLRFNGLNLNEAGRLVLERPRAVSPVCDNTVILRCLNESHAMFSPEEMIEMRKNGYPA